MFQSVILGSVTPIIYGNIIQTPKRHIRAWNDMFEPSE